jgi:hypothetical protein
MRLGVTTQLATTDLAALRFAFAGLALFPVLLQRGLGIDRLGWSGFAAVAIGAGSASSTGCRYWIRVCTCRPCRSLVPGGCPVWCRMSGCCRPGRAGAFRRQGRTFVDRVWRRNDRRRGLVKPFWTTKHRARPLPFVGVDDGIVHRRDAPGPDRWPARRRDGCGRLDAVLSPCLLRLFRRMAVKRRMGRHPCDRLGGLPCQRRTSPNIQVGDVDLKKHPVDDYQQDVAQGHVCSLDRRHLPTSAEPRR